MNFVLIIYCTNVLNIYIYINIRNEPYASMQYRQLDKLQAGKFVLLLVLREEQMLPGALLQLLCMIAGTCAVRHV